MADAPVLCELVDGVLARPRRPRMLEACNPATGELIGLAAVADAACVERAIGSAREAFADGRWCNLPAAMRANLLRDLADAMEENLEPLARAETADTGMLLKMTLQGHVPRAIAHFRHFAEEAGRMAGECFAMDDAYLQLVQREPLGVVAILAPWNAPLAVATINMAAALAAGNTVVVKSSERAPLSLSLLAELVAGVGFPPGVVNIVHGDGATTGRAIAASAGIDGLCFVGGTETARAIVAQGGNPFRRNTFELGGKSPTIVCADARLEEAVDGALLSVFSSNGEVCTAGSRVLVHADLYERFAARFIERTQAIVVGDPCAPASEIGPLIDETQVARVDRFLLQARREGATVACGGERLEALRPGCYVSPAVVTGVTPAMTLFREEVFGPVAALLPFRDEEHALALANDSAYGLSACVWCGDASRGLALGRRLRAGVVSVNAPVIRDVRVAFGGVGASGMGRVGGRWSLEQYTDAKTTALPVNGYALPRYGAKT